MRSSPWLPRLLLGAGVAGLLAAIVSLSIGEGGPERSRSGEASRPSS